MYTNASTMTTTTEQTIMVIIISEDSLLLEPLFAALVVRTLNSVGTLLGPINGVFVGNDVDNGTAIDTGEVDGFIVGWNEG